MISVEKALSYVDIAALSLQSLRRITSRPLAQAAGYELAKEARARLTHPPRNMSAMDGYAVKLSDTLTAPADLVIIGEARAGHPFTGDIKAGDAVRVFTGSVIPKGADTVVIQENTKSSGGNITILYPQEHPKHIRRAGQDFSANDVLIKAGTRLTARHIAVAAAGNISYLDVYDPLKIALLSNGDELKPVGAELKDGQIINSNGPGLTSLLQSWGAQVIDLGIASDDKDDFTARIARAESAAVNANIIIPIGGASVGDHDLAKPAFAAQGYENIFSKVAIRPGKPIWLSQKSGRVVLGLPGNPASALVCAHVFLRPLLGRANHAVSAKLSNSLNANGPRETYLRGHGYINEDGQLMAQAFPRQDSGLITPYAQANILLRLPPHSGPWESGELIDILPIAPLITRS